METVLMKPRLVYFMAPSAGYIPAVRYAYADNVVKALAEFFHVSVIQEDCDYSEVCEKYRPDMTLFDGAVEVKPSHYQIRNTSAFPDIPKVGLMRVDAFTGARALFFSEMDRLGIDTIFAWDTSMGEYTPEIAGRLFYWPACIDTTLFRDYGESKIIPLLFQGADDRPYREHQWRVAIRKLASKYYPSLIVPHYALPSDRPVYSVYGEHYARLLNASMVVPTAGSMSRTLVFKHLEIPASKACLVTERTAVIEAFGFRDMENCVFADEHDVLDKLDYLFNNPETMARIATNGYELIRSRHTAKERPQIYQWLQLHKSRAPGQRIVQRGLFSDLELVDEESGVHNSDVIDGRCEDRVLLRMGDEAVVAGEYHKAEELYTRALEYVPWMAEPQLRLALCALYRGDSRSALGVLGDLVDYTIGLYRVRDPDPVAWAYFLIAMLCRGEIDAVKKYSLLFPWLRHTEIDRARWVISVLTCDWDTLTRTERDMRAPAKHRPSIHALPPCDLEEYVNRVCSMLRSCKQRRLSKALASFMKSPRPFDSVHLPPKIVSGAREVDSSTSLCSDFASAQVVLEEIRRRTSRRGRNWRHRLLVRVGKLVKGLVHTRPRLRAKVKTLAHELHSWAKDL
jgi:hypothetical protein